MKLFSVQIFFIFQDFWATCGLPWKTECALNSLYLIYIFLIIQNFEQLAHALKNKVCPENFHCIEIFLFVRIFEELALALKTEFIMKFFAVFNIIFTFRSFSNFCLPWKTERAWIHCIECIFILQNFEQLVLALKNRVYPEKFYYIEIRIFEELALALKTEFSLNFFTVLNILFTFRIFEQVVLALKNRVYPEFTVLNIYFLLFIILNNLRMPWKTVCPEIFHCIEIFFIFQEFWATWACPENRVCPEFFKPGGGHPPRSPLRTPLGVGNHKRCERSRIVAFSND